MEVFEPTIIFLGTVFSILLMSSPFILLFGGIMMWAYRSEKREWNNGICAKNGLPWVGFDVDSHGGRGYSAGDEVCWISYPGVDRRKDDG